MDKIMKGIAAVSLLLTGISVMLFMRSGAALFETLAITFGTFAWHFCVRLLVGFILNQTMKNQADYHRWWYQPRPWEDRLYRLLRVRKWKKYMPTYYPESFSLQTNSFDALAQVMCQSEVAHEINVVCSFVPLLAVSLFGAFWVFLITSLLAAGFDLCFVIMQRYNRPRVVRLAERERRKHEKM